MNKCGDMVSHCVVENVLKFAGIRTHVSMAGCVIMPILYVSKKELKIQVHNSIREEYFIIS